MPKKLIICLLLAFTLFTSFIQSQYVYLCEGPYSKVYHKTDHCGGLSHCSTKIYKVTLDEAVKMGRRPCKIEYK